METYVPTTCSRPAPVRRGGPSVRTRCVRREPGPSRGLTLEQRETCCLCVASSRGRGSPCREGGLRLVSGGPRALLKGAERETSRGTPRVGARTTTLYLKLTRTERRLHKGSESEAPGLGKFPAADGGVGWGGGVIMTQESWKGVGGGWHALGQRLPTGPVCKDSHPLNSAPMKHPPRPRVRARLPTLRAWCGVCSQRRIGRGL